MQIELEVKGAKEFYHKYIVKKNICEEKYLSDKCNTFFYILKNR